MSELLSAAKALTDVLNRIMARDDWKAVWFFAHNHGINYEGETFEEESQWLTNEVAIAQADVSQTPSPEFPNKSGDRSVGSRD